MIDSQLIFSDNQAITAEADSDNIIFLGENREVAYGKPIPLLITVTEKFETLTELKISVMTDDNETMGAAKELASCSVKAEDLVEGAKIPLAFMPAGNKGYVRLKYTPTESATAGKLFACLTDNVKSSFHNI